MLTGGGVSALCCWPRRCCSPRCSICCTGSACVALVLALGPGGIAEMGLVAVAMGIDPLFVATHHVIRIGLVVLMAPPLFRLWRALARVQTEPES